MMCINASRDSDLVRSSRRQSFSRISCRGKDIHNPLIQRHVCVPRPCRPCFPWASKLQADPSSVARRCLLSKTEHSTIATHEHQQPILAEPDSDEYIQLLRTPCVPCTHCDHIRRQVARIGKHFRVPSPPSVFAATHSHPAPEEKPSPLQTQVVSMPPVDAPSDTPACAAE